MNIGTNSVFFFYVRHSAANKRTKIILPSKRGGAFVSVSDKFLKDISNRR